MRLFLVTVSCDLVVAAESREEALDSAPMHAVEESDNNGETVFVAEGAIELRDPRKVPREWIDSHPCGMEPTTTVREILEAAHD